MEIFIVIGKTVNVETGKRNWINLSAFTSLQDARKFIDDKKCNSDKKSFLNIGPKKYGFYDDIYVEPLELIIEEKNYI